MQHHVLIGIFYSQIVESSSLVSVLFREAISHPYISFFHLLVMFFLLLVFVFFRRHLTFIKLVGSIDGWGGIIMASARKDLILVHTLQLKPMIEVQISGRMASIGISDVVTASVSSEKTRMKKLMMMKMIIIINIAEKPFTSK